MKKRLKISLIVLVGLFLITISIFIGIMRNERFGRFVFGEYPVYESIEELAFRATDIVRGVIINERVERRSTLLPPRNGPDERYFSRRGDFYQIQTINLIEVIDVFKGSAQVGDIMEISQPGGRLGLSELINHDRLYFEQGDDLIFFMTTFYITHGVHRPAVLHNPLQSVYRIATVDDCELAVGIVDAFYANPSIGSILLKSFATNDLNLSLSIRDLMLVREDNGIGSPHPPPPTEQNRNDLRAAIAEAESRNGQNYDHSSWSNVQRALDYARVVYDDIHATQDKIDSVATNLWDAIYNLPRLGCYYATPPPCEPPPTPPIHTGILTTTPWRLYANGNLYVQGGTINWRGGNSPWLPYSEHINRIIFTAPIEAGSYISSLFRGLENVQSIEGLENINTANVTNMNAMFLGASNLTNVEGLSNWDTSNVTRMDFMFSGASSLTHVDLSNWDTSSVTTMDRMFVNASSLQTLNLANWNTRSVTDMSQMFSRASSLTCVGDISHWDTSNVRYMFNMFQYTSSLNSLDLSRWNVGSVVNMSNMFRSSGVTTIGNVSMWNTSNVTNMSNMFMGASRLAQLDLTGWDTRSVNNMAFMFSDTSSLTNVGDLSAWDTRNVANMERMFRNASQLTSLYLSGWDMTGVTNTFQMFSGTASLSTLGLGANFRFNVSGSSTLPTVPSNAMFTGRWQNVGVGTHNNPMGEHILTSAELMDMYRNGETTVTDIWVWQPAT